MTQLILYYLQRFIAYIFFTYAEMKNFQHETKNNIRLYIIDYINNASKSSHAAGEVLAKSASARIYVNSGLLSHCHPFQRIFPLNVALLFHA
jgi:hypothetical protein